MESKPKDKRELVLPDPPSDPNEAAALISKTVLDYLGLPEPTPEELKRITDPENNTTLY